MHNRLYEYPKSKNLIYDLQFGFQQKHSTSRAFIHFTDKFRQQLDKGNFGSGISINFQNVFDTVNFDTLIKKLNYYGVRDTSNNCFFHILKVELNL